MLRGRCWVRRVCLARRRWYLLFGCKEWSIERSFERTWTLCPRYDLHHFLAPLSIPVHRSSPKSSFIPSLCSTLHLAWVSSLHGNGLLCMVTVTVNDTDYTLHATSTLHTHPSAFFFMWYSGFIILLVARLDIYTVLLY